MTEEKKCAVLPDISGKILAISLKICYNISVMTDNCRQYFRGGII